MEKEELRRKANNYWFNQLFYFNNSNEDKLINEVSRRVYLQELVDRLIKDFSKEEIMYVLDIDNGTYEDVLKEIDFAKGINNEAKDYVFDKCLSFKKQLEKYGVTIEEAKDLIFNNKLIDILTSKENDDIKDQYDAEAKWYKAIKLCEIKKAFIRLHLLDVSDELIAEMFNDSKYHVNLLIDSVPNYVLGDMRNNDKDLKIIG